MKDQNYIVIEDSHSFFWSLIVVCFVLVIIFILYQRQDSVQVNTQTMQRFVLTESKQQVSSIKKYFPAPYSVKDITID